MKTKPDKNRRFSLLRIAEELGYSRETVRRQLRAAGLPVGDGRTYTQSEVDMAFAGYVPSRGPNMFRRPVEATTTEPIRDPFRQIAERGAEVAFLDGWSCHESDMIKIAMEAGLTRDQAYAVAVRWFTLLTVRLVAWMFLHAEEELKSAGVDLGEYHAFCRGRYLSGPPAEVEIPLPKWIHKASRAAGIPLPEVMRFADTVFDDEK